MKLRANIKLHNQDCMLAMKDMRDNQFDLSLVDPPYGIGVGSVGKMTSVSRKEYTKKDWDSCIPTKEYFDELKRVSKNQIIWGANYFNNMKASPCWVIWDKKQEFTGAVFEMAWTSFKSPAKAFRMARCEAYCGINKIHPTQKPIALYKWLLTNYAKPGYKLLDTHSGSGSFRIAAYDMGFNLDSCELDPDYCHDNEARYQNHIKQGDLFKPEEIQKQIYQKELIK